MEKLFKYESRMINQSDKSGFYKIFNIVDYKQIEQEAYKLYDNPSKTKIKNKSQQYVKMVKLISKLFHDFDADLHRGNIMWRVTKRKTEKKIQLVVTDPVC